MSSAYIICHCYICWTWNWSWVFALWMGPKNISNVCVLDLWCAQYVAYGHSCICTYISVFALVYRVQYIYCTRDWWDLSHQLSPCLGPSLSVLQSQSTFTLFFKHCDHHVRWHCTCHRITGAAQMVVSIYWGCFVICLPHWCFLWEFISYRHVDHLTRYFVLCKI